jgi:hypothetical protein
MAGRILGPWNSAFDSNGDPISGSTIEFKVNGTSTNKAAYLSAADANAATNPITSQTADAAGRFDPAFGPDDAKYRVIWKDAAGVTIETYDDVEVQGSTSGLIYRDLDTNGRYQVSGDGGENKVWHGDPVGDDSGGSATYSGWDGTQGDDLVFDFASVNVTGDLGVDGVITERGYALARVLVDSGSETSQASVDIALPATFEEYELVLSEVQLSADRSMLACRAGFGAPATFETSGSYWLSYTHTTTNVTQTTGIVIPLTHQMELPQVKTVLRYRIWTPGLSIDGGGFYQGDVGSGSVQTLVRAAGKWSNNLNKATAIRLLAAVAYNDLTAAGNVAFDWKLYGIAT